MMLPGIAIVTRPTRLQGLRERWGTTRQAKFLLKQAHAVEAERAQAVQSSQGPAQAYAPPADADFDAYEQEDAVYRGTIETLHRELDFGLPVKLLDRSFVPNFDFW